MTRYTPNPTCGTCSKFDRCWRDSSQFMKSIGAEPKDDYQESKSIPACPEYERKKV